MAFALVPEGMVREPQSALRAMTTKNDVLHVADIPERPYMKLMATKAKAAEILGISRTALYETLARIDSANEWQVGHESQHQLVSRRYLDLPSSCSKQRV